MHWILHVRGNLWLCFMHWVLHVRGKLWLCFMHWVLHVRGNLWLCFMHWAEVFDRVEWSKLQETLRESRVNWRERKLIRNLHVGKRGNCASSKGNKAVLRLVEDETGMSGFTHIIKHIWSILHHGNFKFG